ncbi:transposase IS3/IS911 family protein [uncultured Gammaproteobacteria bacterium]|nr:transposase IS3/IS911 family protein [uncultured Gammaproteobacteria bacterium]
MSKKRTKYTSTFKTKLVLELLQNKSTLVQIASKHNILSQNLQNWKKTFLANAEIAMEPSKAVKEYKEELIKSQKQNERLTTLVGKVTVEKEWLAKKLKSLGLSNCKQLVESSYLHHTCRVLFCRLISNANDWVLIEVACITNQGQTTPSKPSKITAHKCLNKYPFMVREKSISNYLKMALKSV